MNMTLRLPSITEYNAKKYFYEIELNGEIHSEINLVFIESRDDYDRTLTDYDLESLKKRIEAAKIDFLNTHQKISKNNGGLFDSMIPEIVHSELSRLAAVDDLADLGFWRWLSIVSHKNYFYELIKWRYKFNDETKMQESNFGIVIPRSSAEGFFFRAWLRGHKMYNPESDDPYMYSKMGLSDLWRSQILRQDHGRDQNFVKAFLDLTSDIPQGQMRTIWIPALRAWSSSSTFSHLNYEDCKKLIIKLKEGQEEENQLDE